MKKYLFIFLMTYSLTITLSQYFVKLQNILILSAQNLQTQFSKRCQPEIKQCNIKSYDMCSYYLPKDIECNTNYSTPVFCQKCHQPGALVSLNHTTVRLPNQLYQNLDQNQRAKQSVCYSTLFEQILKNASYSTDQISLFYYGDSSGLNRIYPGFKQHKQNDICIDYDPRIRPWYVGASVGSKNLIILIDRSLSLAEQDKINIQKKITNKLISNSLPNDKLNLIKFNSFGQKYSEKLVSANMENKNKMVEWVNQIIAQGDTSFSMAFNQAYQIFNNSDIDNTKENVIILLTDGELNLNQQKQQNYFQQLQKNISDWNTGINSIIFIYIIGRTKNDFFKQLTCAHKGIINYIDEQNHLNSKLNKFYQYLTLSKRIEDIFYTNIYQNIYTFGQTVTISYPAYEKQNPQYIIGVLAMDINLIKIQQSTNVTIQQLQEYIEKNNLNLKEIKNENFNECYIQELREQKCAQDQDIFLQGLNCSIQNKSCQIQNKQNVFYNSDYDAYVIFETCCNFKQTINFSCRKIISAIMVLGIIFGSIFILGSIYFCIQQKTCKKNKILQDQNIASAIQYIKN